MTSPPLSWAQKLAIGWLGAVLLAAGLAGALPLPYPPDVPDLAHVAQAPFGPGRHWLGTDPQGRDVLSVLVFGARTAVGLTLPAALLAALLGAVAGGAAGYWGNRARLPAPYWLAALGLAWWGARLPLPALGLGVALAGLAGAGWARGRARHGWRLPLDSGVMGLATLLDTIPRLVLVVAAGAGLSGVGLLGLLLLTAWPQPARLVRAQMLRVRALPFLEAARAAGLPAGRVWWRHAMPHAWQPLRTALPLSLAGLLGLESTLSFLGIGLPPDVASWGRLLATARAAPEAWWVFVFPGGCLIISILSLYALARQRPIPR